MRSQECGLSLDGDHGGPEGARSEQGKVSPGLGLPWAGRQAYRARVAFEGPLRGMPCRHLLWAHTEAVPS